jgi:hypothetical protein
VWEPALYQGGRTRRRYFEGWYFKCVDAGEEHPVAVIPGVSYAADGSRAQAFVQLIRRGGHTRFFEYAAADFSFAARPPFRVAVGPNTFAADGMTLDLHDAQGAVSGHVGFGPWRGWPVRPFSPGIMGWYRFVPRMECYHGVLSLDHSLHGALSVDGDTLDFGGGCGYVEKDWGTSFPSSWVWMQSNTFGTPEISLTCSVARIPWVTGAFVGHIAGLLHGGRLYRFATYTGAKLAGVETWDGGAHVVLRDARKELELRAEGGAAGDLKAPVLGAMEGRVGESLGASVSVRLRELRGGRPETVFEGGGRCAGLEVVDARGELVADA